MFNTIRENRTFENFLELQNRRIDNPSDGLNAQNRALALKKIRGNLRARRQCCNDAHTLYEAALENGSAYKENGDIMTFLEWLLANADTIIALIQRLISLFGL